MAGADPPNLAEAKAALKDIVKEGDRASDVIGRIRGLLRHHKHEHVELDSTAPSGKSVALTMGAMQRPRHHGSNRFGRQASACAR